MKSFKYVFLLSVFALAVICSSCQQTQKSTNNQLFVVDFQKNKPLHYKMVSERDVLVKFTGSDTTKKKNSEWNMTEKLEIDAVFTLKDTDSMGLYVIEASYPNVKVSRKGKSRNTGKDAAEYLQGRSVTFKMTPAGTIVEPNELTKLIQDLGDKAFGTTEKTENIKSQDMISDFVELQWFMFDPVAKLKDPLKGIKPGQSWDSVLNVPTPRQLNATRNALYTLSEVKTENGYQKAIIDANYSLSKQKQQTPRIYSGRNYRQKGFFGVLKSKPIALDGTGQMIYNLDKGIIEKFTQQYRFTATAVLFIPLPGTEDSKMTIDQKFSIELVENN